MSKLYRCPHCGEIGISYGDKLWYRTPRRIGDNRYGDYDLKCSECNGKCWTDDSNNVLGVVSTYMMVGSLPIAVIVLFFTKSPWWCLGVLGFALLFNMIFNVFNEISAPIFMIDEEGHMLSFVPNTEAEIGRCKYLKPYGIYRLQFESKTENHKFKERFRGGMVPAQIVPRKKQKGVYDLRIIDKEFVPDEVLLMAPNSLSKTSTASSSARARSQKPIWNIEREKWLKRDIDVLIAAVKDMF